MFGQAWIPRGKEDLRNWPRTIQKDPTKSENSPLRCASPIAFRVRGRNTSGDRREMLEMVRSAFRSRPDLFLSHGWDCLHEGSVNDCCELITNKFMEFVNLSIPHKDVMIRPNDKPWYDSEIRRYSSKRDRLKTKAVRTSQQSGGVCQSPAEGVYQRLVPEGCRCWELPHALGGLLCGREGCAGGVCHSPANGVYQRVPEGCHCWEPPHALGGLLCGRRGAP